MAGKGDARLEIVCGLIPHLGFKSLTLRQAMMGNHQTRAVLLHCAGLFYLQLLLQLKAA